MAIKTTLFEFWKQKEIEWGRPIRVTEVARATGISRDALTRLRDGKTPYPDNALIDKLCKFFDIEPGSIPFLTYTKD